MHSSNTILPTGLEPIDAAVGGIRCGGLTVLPPGLPGARHPGRFHRRLAALRRRPLLVRAIVTPAELCRPRGQARRRHRRRLLRHKTRPQRPTGPLVGPSRHRRRRPGPPHPRPSPERDAACRTPALDLRGPARGRHRAALHAACLSRFESPGTEPTASALTAVSAFAEASRAIDIAPLVTAKPRTRC